MEIGWNFKQIVVTREHFGLNPYSNGNRMELYIAVKQEPIRSLNPYFNGNRMEVFKVALLRNKDIRLNPYSNGMRIELTKIVNKETKQTS